MTPRPTSPESTDQEGPGPGSSGLRALPTRVVSDPLVAWSLTELVIATERRRARTIRWPPSQWPPSQWPGISAGSATGGPSSSLLTVVASRRFVACTQRQHR